MRSLRSPLFARLFGLFLLASLTPVLGAGYLTQELAAESVRAEASRRHRRMAELTAVLAVDAIERAEAKLVTVARLMSQDVAAFAAPDSAYRDAVLERLAAQVEPADVFLELQYFASGEEPELVAVQQQRALPPFPDTSRQAQILRNASSEPVRVPLFEGVAWRGSRLEHQQGRTTLATSVPVSTGADDTVRGAIVAYIDFRELVETLARLAGDDYALRVRDGAENVLVDIGTAGSDELGATVPAGQEGWTASVTEPRAQVEAPLASLRRQILLWIGVALFLAVTLSLTFSAWITRPVSRLRRAVETMEGGDFTARATSARTDELGELSRAFNRMAEALGALDEAKSDFVANVSHELRTPLTSMRVSVANLLDGVVGEVSPRQAEAIARIQDSVDRMIALVDELLEMARLEAGVVAASREDVELAALAHDCVRAVEPTATERGVALEVRGAGRAACDRSMLRRVLLNLLDNAIKFSPKEGTVSVRVEDGVLRVVDQGPGVGSEDVFEKFRQGEASGVKHAGFGLGLAIVKKLVELNGGTVRVENAVPGPGAAFVVSLQGGAR